MLPSRALVLFSAVLICASPVFAEPEPPRHTAAEAESHRTSDPTDTLLEEEKGLDSEDIAARAHLPRLTETQPARPMHLSLLGWYNSWSFASREMGGGLVLSLPLERFGSPPRTLRSRMPLATSMPTAHASTSLSLEAPQPAGNPSGRTDQGRLQPAEIRSLVHAAWKAAGLQIEETRLCDLASRARTSAALPELRLRALRTFNETARLSPTEFDPVRVQAGGGNSLLLEARGTWRLDRLLFADDEIALERLRVDRSEQRMRLTAQVLEALSAWQKARAIALDPSLSTTEKTEALLRAVEAETTLEALTEGAWSKRPMQESR